MKPIQIAMNCMILLGGFLGFFGDYIVSICLCTLTFLLIHPGYFHILAIVL